MDTSVDGVASAVRNLRQGEAMQVLQKCLVIIHFRAFGFFTGFFAFGGLPVAIAARTASSNDSGARLIGRDAFGFDESFFWFIGSLFACVLGSNGSQGLHG